MVLKRQKYTLTHRLLSATALAGAVSLFVSPAYALPQGGTVGAGSADITSGSNATTITQSSQRAVIDWSSFNIGSGESVRFNQPNAGSIDLNRIHDANSSRIDGSLSANGQVWLVNPNGMMFGSGSQVSVGGLLATSSDIDNSRFMSGDNTFDRAGSPTSTIGNAGHITIADSGLAALVGPNVTNSGLIEARLGKVQLGSGDTFAIDLYGDGLINLQASSAIAGQLVENSGTIKADGGEVLMTAAAAQSTVNSLINMDGVVQANSVGEQDGHVVFYAAGSNAVQNNDAANKGIESGSSEVLVSGSVSAAGAQAGETGGTVEALGDHVGILSGVSIDASGSAGGGTIRIGGDFHGQGATPTASATIVQDSTNLYADATDSGNGGKVTVWADDYTDFGGNIEAKGGPNGGDGGQVETSGKVTLNMQGRVDASAPQGNAGTWLMDPEDVNITSSDSDITGSPNFVPGGSQATASLNVSDIDAALNADTNVTVTTGGDSQSGPNGGSITVSSAISAATGTAGATGSLTLSSYTNITLNAGITLGGTGVTGGALTLRSDNAGNGSGYIYVAPGANIVTNGGNISMGGGSGAITAGTLNADGTINTAATGYATGNSGKVQGIYVRGNVDAGGGDIIMNGKGYNGSSSGNDGVELLNAAVSTSAAGTIALSGIGQGTSNSDNDYGVSAIGTSTVSTEDGTLTITGTGGGAGTGGYNYGFLTANSSTVKTTGSGNILIHGAGGNGDGTNDSGIEIASPSAVRADGSGGITFDGSGGDSAGSGDYNDGIYISGTVAASGGPIAFTGAAGSGTGSTQYGIFIADGTVSDAGSGTITMTGTGDGNGSSAGSNNGMAVANGGSISTVSGDLTLNGTGGAGTSGLNYGVYISDSGTSVSSQDGTVSLNGTGGGNAGSDSNFGVDIQNSAAVSTSSSGDIDITGTAIAGVGSENTAVNINSSASVATVDGNITISGNSDGTGSANYGLYMDRASVESSGSGGIVIHASGSANGSDGAGALISNTPISTVSGDIDIKGTEVDADGFGLYLQANAAISSGTGNITLTGANNGGANAIFDNPCCGSVTLGSATDNGNITLVADGLSLDSGFAVQTLKNAIIQPYSANTSIGVAGGAGTLAVTSDLLGEIAAASITIGNAADTGLLTADAYSWSSNATLLSGSGGIAIDGAQTMGSHSFLAQTGGSDITLGTSGSIASTASGTAITMASGQNFVNDNGSGDLSATNGRWLVYSANPADDTDGALANDFRRFSCTYGGSCPSFPATGNGFLYSDTPTLTVTPDAASTTYGSAAPGFSYTLSGYLGSDGGSDAVTGAADYSTTYAMGDNVGSYDITANGSTLTSALGYRFSGATLADGLTVNPASLTVTANNASGIYGSNVPTLTYTYTGLTGGDTSSVFTGALTSGVGSAGATITDNVGSYGISQGTLSAGGNYTIAYNVGTFTVNPASLTVTATNASKTYGDADPALAYTYTGLVGGDASASFTGTIARVAGEDVGTYGIAQNTLAAAGNYIIGMFNDGIFTIQAATSNGAVGSAGKAAQIAAAMLVSEVHQFPVSPLFTTLDFFYCFDSDFRFCAHSLDSPTF